MSNLGAWSVLRIMDGHAPAPCGKPKNALCFEGKDAHEADREKSNNRTLLDLGLFAAQQKARYGVVTENAPCATEF